MRKHALWFTLPAALVVALLAWTGQAQADEGPSRVQTNIPVPLLVNRVLESSFPKVVPPSTEVCAQAELMYQSEGERVRFLGWVVGSATINTLCFTTGAEAWTYTGMFQKELLLQVTSVVPEVAKYQWVAAGSVVSISAPELVTQSDTRRLRFASWSGGMSPSTALNQVVVVKATTIEARYTAEYAVKVVSPVGAQVAGEGWYASGQSATIRIPDIVVQSDTKRLRLARWDADGIAASALPTTPTTVFTFTVNGPVTFRPQYVQEYLVTAQGPQGTISYAWTQAEKAITLETPATLEGLRFVMWKYAWSQDALARTTKLELVVTEPLKLEAVYEATSPTVTPTPTPTPSTAATLQANAPVSLLVGGVEVKQFPATVASGSRVCAPSADTYVAEGERYRFLNWSNGSQELCLEAPAGPIAAQFERQFLLKVTSNVKSVEQSTWVAANSVVNLEVPEAIDDADTRWTFESWSLGEQTSTPKNQLAVLKPTVVEAKYVARYLVQVVPVPDVAVSGGGWYKPGEVAVLRTPATVEQDSDRRLRFLEWEEKTGRPVPGASLQQTELNVQVNGPLVLQPKYVQEYLVKAENPQGVLALSWLEAGKTLDLETPAVVDVIEGEERLRFTHWQEKVADAPPLAQIAKLVLPIERPIELEAVYRREFKVTLMAAYGGSGTGWYPENSIATLSVPPQPQAVLFLKKVFVGFAGYPETGPVLQVLVNAPMTVGAVYRNEVDFKVLIFIVAGLLVAFLIWRLTEARAAHTQPASQPREEEVIEEIIEDDVGASPPISTGRRPPPDDASR